MPPNFQEFAERMEASLSEVSEAGASNPSLQEKKESSSALTGSSGNLDHREPQSESLTLEHVAKSTGIPGVQDMKNLSGDCQDFRFQHHSESSPQEFHPVESETAAASGNTDVTQEHRFSSATWPRATKSSATGSFSEKQHPLGDTACTVEIPPLSPCLSEELLDPELHILVTPSLREKTESELKFEEDERWIMMEAEEEWEEEKLSEREKALLMADENSLADILEEREQANTVAVVEDGASCLTATLGTFDSLPLDQICYSDNPQTAREHLASKPKDAPLVCSCVPAGEDAIERKNGTAQGLEHLVSELECTVGPVDAEQLSDTDSEQMFLELEKECLCEEGVVEPQNQASSEGLAPSQDAENSLVISHFPGAALEKEQHLGFLNVRVKDHATGLDCEYFNALDSSQMPNARELVAYPEIMRDNSTVSKEYEKVPFSPKTGEEFKSPVDLESLRELNPGGLLISDHRASYEQKLSGFVTSELAKEDGNLFQVDCNQTEENVECIESVPLSFASNYELTVVTSGPKVEVLLYDSNLLTNEIHLESEKGAINQENNSLASLENAVPCELSIQKVCNEASEAKELDYQAKFGGDGAPAHFHTDFPEQVFQDLQRKSPELEILSLHLLAGELRHGSDGVETLNDVKPKPNVVSSQGEMELRDSDPFLNIFAEEQVTKAGNTEPVLEEWIPSLQRPAPTAAVPAVEEDALDATVPTPEGTAIAADVVSFPEANIPVVLMVTLEEDATTAEVSAPAGPTTPEEPPSPTPAGPTTPEEPSSPTPAGPTTPAEPVSPAPAGSTTLEEPSSLAPAGPITPEEPASLVPAGPTTPEEPDTQAVRVSTPEGLATPTATVPALEEVSPTSGPFLRGAVHSDSVPIAEGGTSVLGEASATGMWIKEDLDPSAFGIKEVPGTLLHGKMPLTATGGLNSNEVIIAYFVAREGLESKMRLVSSQTL
uniref:Uncharacterized protein n=1 Tax=Marmota marmota marmota TaxID=9994 RepID=A0A8C5YT94_MARMA